jgi:hypothetical protein
MTTAPKLQFVEEYSAGPKRRQLVLQRLDRWLIAHGAHNAPLGSYVVDGPFDSFADAKKVALGREARAVANDVGPGKS